MPGLFNTDHVNKTMNEKVAKPTSIAAPEDIRKTLKIDEELYYVKNPTYIADVKGLLGTVYFEDKKSNALKRFVFSVRGSVDPNSILNAPVTVSELIINNSVKAKIDAFSFINMGLSAEDLLEVRTIDNAAARFATNGADWENAISIWMGKEECQKLMNDPEVGSVSVVTGVVQKYFTTKKYQKFDSKVQGGSFGVNVDGSLYTSTSQFELSVVYGLDLLTFPSKHNHEMGDELIKGIVTKSLVGHPIETNTLRKLLQNMTSLLS